MDWNIAVLGPVGAGKSTAIRNISDIEVLNTDVDILQPSASGHLGSTTVAMDMGVVALGNGDALRLLGAPGQTRFDFMGHIVLGQAIGAVIVIDHRRATRMQDLELYWQAVQARTLDASQARCPVTIAVTHAERYIDRNLALYQEFFLQRSPCPCSLCQPPVLWCDARERRDVAAVLIVMAALLESLQLHPESVLHQRMSP